MGEKKWKVCTGTCFNGFLPGNQKWHAATSQCHFVNVINQ